MIILALRGSLGSSDEKNIKIDEEIEKERCEKHPAGNPISLESGDACMFVYDDEGKPVDGIEIENITPSKAKVKKEDTGEKVGELEI